MTDFEKVQHLGECIVKEFLIQRKMDKTLECFKTESQKRPTMMRSTLIQDLNLQGLVKKNRLKKVDRFTNLIDIICNYLYNKKTKILSTQPSELRSNNPTQKTIQHSNTIDINTDFSVADKKLDPVGHNGVLLSNDPKQVNHFTLNQPDHHQSHFTLHNQDSKQKCSYKSEQHQDSQQYPKQDQQQKQKQDQIANDNDIETIIFPDDFSTQNNKQNTKINLFRNKKESSEQKSINLFNKKQQNDQKKQQEKQHQQEKHQQKQNSYLNNDLDVEECLEEIDIEKEYVYKKIDISKQNVEYEFDQSKQKKTDFDFINQNYYNHNFNIKKDLKRVSKEDSDSVRQLLFGKDGQMNYKFYDPWKQGFEFNNNDNSQHDLYFGLIQKDGGPCGVIASVQAYFIKYILYHNDIPRFKTLSNQDQQNFRLNCLLLAIRDILYNQNTSRIKLALKDDRSNINSVARIDQCLVKEIEFQDRKELFIKLVQFKDDFIRNDGVVLLMYSVILSKGIELIQSEMDDGNNCMIGEHQHCTQEMVNLMLTGKAASNCFDGEKQIDGDYFIKGISQQSEIGFLSIFEHYKYIQIEKNYKQPVYPIWVIIKEYHYSVVFGLQQEIINKEQNKFDIVFYDQMNHKDELIRLTFEEDRCDDQHENQIEVDEDLVPSLELLLKTKWSAKYIVDWNGTEPIL